MRRGSNTNDAHVNTAYPSNNVTASHSGYPLSSVGVPGGFPSANLLRKGSILLWNLSSYPAFKAHCRRTFARRVRHPRLTLLAPPLGLVHIVAAWRRLYFAMGHGRRHALLVVPPNFPSIYRGQECCYILAMKFVHL